MRFESFIVWLVLLGLLFSLKGRVEPELDVGWTSNGLGVMSVAEKDNEAFPMGQTRPLGDHKDLHGCIHVHAPCVLSAVELPARATRAPVTSKRSGIFPSAIQPHNRDRTIKKPP